MFLDIAFGIFGGYLTGIFFHEVISWGLVVAGIIFVLLPDIDIFWNMGNKKKVDHRGYIHYPFLYIIVSFVLVFINYKIAFLFLITTLFHFVHDTFILGWGVAWLAPFSYRRYKIFPDDGKGGFLQEKFLTWLPSGQEALEKKLEDKHWIKNWYGKVTIVSVVEYVAFLTACAYIVNTFII